jgi:hypothetical protein
MYDYFHSDKNYKEKLLSVTRVRILWFNVWMFFTGIILLLLLYKNNTKLLHFDIPAE